ncbi:hypothetical protein VNO80_06387 [Phaseolus coccineus]|uniref:Uncharacterized protein n=1 Tax=Phaseolus coccineus TaxID=3886 RepID=A0AAN9RIP1_PHACN
MAARVTVDSVARGTSRTYNVRRLAAGAASGGGSSELARLLVQIWKFVQNEPAPSCDGGVWSCNGGGWSCDEGGWSYDGGGWSCDGVPNQTSPFSTFDPNSKSQKTISKRIQKGVFAIT